MEYMLKLAVKFGVFNHKQLFIFINVEYIFKHLFQDKTNHLSS